MIRNVMIAAACSVSLAACQSIEQNPNTAAGLATGATFGALAGLLVGGDDRRNALVGAGIGLLAGAAVGNYLDEQQRALEDDLDGTGATVSRIGDQLLVSMPAQVTFATDRSDIQPEFYGPLNDVAETLNTYAESFVDIVGHTDATGPTAYNQQLSLMRADTVARYLTAQGVASARLATGGRGETAPVASNDTADGRQANRRVEIIITPATES